MNGVNGPAPFTSDLSGLDGTAFPDPSLLSATLDPTMMPIPTMSNMMNGFDGVPAEAISAGRQHPHPEMAAMIDLDQMKLLSTTVKFACGESKHKKGKLMARSKSQIG